MTDAHVDVLVVGAGLSGIGAAWHLQHRCPWARFAVIEARDAIGGTWDLFRYPGIRSDSDMYTLGYRFRPWREGKAIADGPSIKRYIEETARESGIDRAIRFRHRMVRAEWSSADARWTIHMEVGPERTPATITCGFLYTCTGYYDYAAGYTPDWPGLHDFRGTVVHPQHWPAALDYRGKRVVVIGSGATAVTLVPAMATGPDAAAHVTMLQRSPTWIAEQPSRDTIADALRAVLPPGVAYAAVRWKNIARSMFYYAMARRAPRVFAKGLHDKQRAALGDAVPLDPHFTPRYAPWDERLCLVPDGDLFRVLREGRAEMVTDRIAHFDAEGLVLESGRRLDADIVVTATGLVMRLLAGVTVVVDGRPVTWSDHMAYRGMMCTDIPNMASAFGYTNASWTLKCDLVAEHVCRLLRHMRAHGLVQVTPRRDATVGEAPALDFSSGYVQRALPTLPRQGTRAPWKLDQQYLKDLVTLRLRRVDDPALEFRTAAPRGSAV
ncbi:MAG: NAD(P)/FAD-dependent oxidoreductase [Gemmatimonadaceae bacterium]|nr:NAD(P)/FAD-dependent oxidoreductase [Gemmatimonadaceae bacterium]